MIDKPRLEDVLLQALRAQMRVSEKLMRHLGYADQDVADCTAQARAAISRMEKPMPHQIEQGTR